MLRATAIASLVLLTGCPPKPQETASPPVDLEYGEACEATSECRSGLFCAGDAVCRYEGDPGTFQLGDFCLSTPYCELGLVCAADGTCQSPGGPGTGASADTCEGDNDCQLGLGCEDGGCHGFPMPLWNGADCVEPGAGPFRILFEVPGDEPVTEFYRLPFPNDARVIDGRLDLSGHPTPGALIEQLGDTVGEMFEAMVEDFDGFGTNQAVFFRLSDRPDFGTMSLGVPGEGTLSVIDVTPDSPTWGQRHPGVWRSHSGRKQYMCHNWIALHPSDGRPYQPGRTYAALVTTSVQKHASNVGAGQDPDFAAVMAQAPPSEARLQRAWEAYQPLRDYVDAQPWSASALAGATVFTVQDPTEPPRRLRASVRDTADAPEATGLVSCESGEPGPYSDSEDPTRGCPASPATGFVEVQGTLRIPQYQDGTPPFKEPGSGGRIDFSYENLSPHRYDEVVFSLTIPRGVDMPEGGWPLVLYAHGTGGNHRSAIRTGMAGELASVALGGGDEAHLATLSIDGVMHGPRRNRAAWDPAWLEADPRAYDPAVLFSNTLNLRAARDNTLQHAADWFTVVRWVEGAALGAATSPTGQAIDFDTDRLYYMGHSQGAVAGAVFAPYEPALDAVVLAAGGALVIETLLNKREPFDLTAALRTSLVDAGLDRRNPMLNLVQMTSERADGVNHARHLFQAPSPRHLLQIYGVGDQWTPDATQYALARALDIDQVAGGSEALQHLPVVSEPVTGNHWPSGVTAVVRLYEPIGTGDPNLVTFDRADARRQVSRFFGTAVRDGTPTLVNP